MYAHAQNSPDAWIEINEDCIGNWSCKFSPYKTLRIRTDTDGINSPESFVQDIFLGATFFIGTLATFWLVISGMLMVFWWADEWMYEKWKQWFKYSLIGVLLVILSYTIIRAVQYVAQWTA
jgi:hypothetical protein